MTDGRRSQWFAMDAWFFDNPLGVALRERFGVTGLVVFVGFLGACKRSHIQGRISYTTDADALRLMGLPELRLVDEAGDEWTLDSFWRALGQLKQTRKTTRGRIKNVEATNWSKWQQGLDREHEAARKRRSRGRNTPDDAPPIPGKSPDDAPPLPRTDSDSDNDSDYNVRTEHESDTPDPFDAFWFAYPRKDGKLAAKKAWTKAVKAAGGPEPIIAGAARFAADPNREPTFTPYPQKWLNDGHWENGPLPAKTRNGAVLVPTNPDLEEWQRR